MLPGRSSSPVSRVKLSADGSAIRNFMGLAPRLFADKDIHHSRGRREVFTKQSTESCAVLAGPEANTDGGSAFDSAFHEKHHSGSGNIAHANSRFRFIRQ